MKLANWNVALPVAPTRRKRLREWTDRIAADIWVLTETHDDFTPGLPHACKSAPGRDGKHEAAHRWVTIWSQHPLEPVTTTDNERTAAARVFPNGGKPFLVFATVLPWIGSPWRGHPSAGGTAFAEALKIQASDWQRLRNDHRDEDLFVVGDFNQDLANSRYYGSSGNRAALQSALDACGLVALTSGEGDPIRRDSAPWACIDHICAVRDSRWQAQSAVRWPDTPKPDKRLSDHFGVAIAFSRESTR